MDESGLANQSFDVAVSRYALHHANDVEAVADELTRLVRPTGRVVIVDFAAAPDETTAGAYDDTERLRDPSHVRNLSADQIQSLFERRGWQVVSTATYQLPVRIDKLLASSNGTDHQGFVDAFERSLDNHRLLVRVSDRRFCLQAERCVTLLAHMRSSTVAQFSVSHPWTPGTS